MPLIRWLLNVEPLWNTPEEFTEALGYLPTTTHEHILKFLRPSDRKLALGSQILQHLLISKYRNIPFENVRIVRNFGGITGGRPVFLGGDGIEGVEYNVSHHGSIVGIVSRLLPPNEGSADEGGGIGIDVLEYEKRPHYVDGNLGAVKEWAEGFGEAKVFTGQEMGVIKAAGYSGMEEVVKAVHLNWTVKEAYVKAVGTGLVTDLTKVEFRLVGVKEGLEEEERVNEVELWIGGGGSDMRQAEEWYIEVERLVRKGLEEVYCVALATRVEGLEDSDKRAPWLWLEYTRDLLPYMQATIE